MPQALKHWKCESCCFASAGLGRCHEITTTDHRRNGLLLNRRGVDIALVPERLEQWLSQPQVIESDLSIDRDSGLADRDGGESLTLEGSLCTPRSSVSCTELLIQMIFQTAFSGISGAA